MTQWIADHIIYDTETSTIIASNAGAGFTDEKRLYRSNNGKYFLVDGSRFSLTQAVQVKPLSQDDAVSEWNLLQTKVVGYKEAFPEIEFSDA